MKHFSIALLTVFSFGWALAPLCAQSSTDTALSLESARAMALQTSTELRQAEIAFKTAVNREGIAVSEFFPSLDAGFSLKADAEDLINGNLAPSVSLTASQTIINSGSRWFKLKSANLASQAKAVSLDAKRLEVLAQADSAWFAVLKAEDSMQAARLKETAAQTALALAESKESMGLATRSTVLQAKSKLASATSERVQAEYTLLSAQNSLERQIGQKITSLQRTDQTEEELYLLVLTHQADTQPLINALLSLAAERAPSVVSARIAVEEAGYAIAQDVLSYLPISASLSYNLANDAKNWAERASLQISAKLPIFPINSRLKNSENVALSKESAALALGNALADLEEQLFKQLVEIISARSRLESSTQALSWAEENYNLVLQRYEMGMEDWQSLSDAEQTLSSSRNSEIARRYDSQTALTSLKTVLGIEDSAELIKVLSRVEARP